MDFSGHCRKIVPKFKTDYIVQSDFSGIVNNALYNRENINILTGVHGYADGTTLAAPEFYVEDMATFGGTPGINIYDISSMTPAQINGVLDGPGTTIGAFCNSGACLMAPK